MDIRRIMSFCMRVVNGHWWIGQNRREEIVAVLAIYVTRPDITHRMTLRWSAPLSMAGQSLVDDIRESPREH